MKRRANKTSLSAQVLVIRDVTGKGSSQRAIRRAVLVDKENGLIYELPTVYVLRTLGKYALNTQIAALFDLAFYLEWVKLRFARSKDWTSPETRIKAGGLALSQKEVDDFSNWCQNKAEDLSRARQLSTEKITVIRSTEDCVEGSTTNRRLNTVCNYLCWLTRDMVEGAMMLEDRQIAKSAKFQESLKRAFSSAANSAKSPPPFASLNRADAKAFREAVTGLSEGVSSDHDKRDALIGRLLLETGLRAGELLKLQCEDLDDNFEINTRRFVAVLKVIKRPNDATDERMIEPSAKTMPGPIPISRALARELLHYIVKERRAAIDRGVGLTETPYLFVSHSGPRTGRPMSYRNLNRIVAKVRGRAGVTSPLTPHTLRHTHFTELRDLLAAKGTDPREAFRILQERGHWSPNSSMPDHYSQRHLAERHAHFVEERDRILGKLHDD